MKNQKISNKTVGALFAENICNTSTIVPNKTKNTSKGITLIALIITIIVLLILAGITINLIIGEHGIIKMAEKAGKDYQKASTYEKNELNSLYLEMINGDIQENEQPIIEVGYGTHIAKKIPYTWEELNSIAKVISDNYGTGERKVNDDTAEVMVNINEKLYTLGVGDWIGNVRILGFNHDILVSKDAYGKDSINIYAGITFGFTDYSYGPTPVNSPQTNQGGWGACQLRRTLNTDKINELPSKEYIKEVSKEYIETYNDPESIKFSNDKLWLLSCAEIWEDGCLNTANILAVTKEGKQYKLYKNINANYMVENSAIMGSGAFAFSLRTPYIGNDKTFLSVDDKGKCIFDNEDDMMLAFCI